MAIQKQTMRETRGDYKHRVTTEVLNPVISCRKCNCEKIDHSLLAPLGSRSAYQDGLRQHHRNSRVVSPLVVPWQNLIGNRNDEFDFSSDDRSIECYADINDGKEKV